MNYSKTLALAFACASLTAVANAATIFDQIGTGAGATGAGYASQNITDFAPAYNIIAIENTTTSSAWHLDSVDFVGLFFNASAPNTANITNYQFAVYSTAVGGGGTNGNNNTGDVLNANFAPGSVTITPNFNSVTGNYLFHVDLSSANLNLNAGSYWFGVAVDMVFGGGVQGELGVVGTSMTDASSSALDARQMNGGGGFALAGNNAPIAGGANLMYRLNASPVPEPASMAVLGIGALVLLRRRSKKA